MEIEKVTIFNDINPAIQKQLHEQYKKWNANRSKHSKTMGGIGIKGYFKCSNCKKYFLEEDTVSVRFPSGKKTRRCLLCNMTINTSSRIRRR